jgi:hypothetical protein
MTPILCLFLGFHAPVATKVTLRFSQDNFIVSDGKKNITVPIDDPASNPAKAISFRKGATFAVWDERGLTIRVGRKVFSTKLPEIAVSPKMQERSAIKANLPLFASGKRSKSASAISGAKRVGSEAFFLARWDDSDGKSWLEALVKVDLDSPTPEWKLVGRYAGLTLARKFIDHQLILRDGALTAIVRKGDEWGRGFYSPVVDAFGYKAYGKGLVDFQAKRDLTGDFVEETGYGTIVAGKMNFETEERTEMLESKAITLVDSREPMLAIVANGTQKAIRNADSGAEKPLPADAVVKRTPLGTLIWAPAAKPTQAWLCGTESFTTEAEWTQAARGSSSSKSAGL